MAEQFTYDQVMSYCARYAEDHPDQRNGQAHYNAVRLLGLPAHEAPPEADCFSVDKRLPAFLAWLARYLAEQQPDA